MDRPPERVRAALARFGLPDVAIKEFSDSTATAADAAAAIGTSVERIVKSLIFMAGDRPILVMASGQNRVDVAKLTELVGDGPIKRAIAEQVRRATSFAIGGVPPVGHAEQLATYIDHDLLRYDEVWAAAGTPNSVFPIDPQTLVRITSGQVVNVAEDRA